MVTTYKIHEMEKKWKEAEKKRKEAEEKLKEAEEKLKKYDFLFISSSFPFERTFSVLFMMLTNLCFPSFFFLKKKYYYGSWGNKKVIQVNNTAYDILIRQSRM